MEFSENALKTINEFIKKTYDLEYEIVLYFDYVTGEILKCAIGDIDNVKIDFVNEGNLVASIHIIHMVFILPPMIILGFF